MSKLIKNRFKPNYLAAMACFALLFACSSQNDKKNKQQIPALPVSVIQISTHDTPISMEYVGQTAGFREVEIHPRVGGILLKRNYLEGHPVKEGDLLFQIDPAPFKAALDQARANLQLKQANLTSATQNYQRVLPLFTANAVSQKDRDDAVANYQAAKASVAVAQAQLQDAKINLSYTNVRSPIDGITSKETRSEGSLVSSAGSPLTTVSQLNPLYVNFSISDNDNLQMQKNIAAGKLKLPTDTHFSVHLVLSDGSIFAQTGKMSFTDSIVDSSTGSVRARAEFPNPDNSILPGQFVRVRLEGGELQNAILIPDTAILTTQQGKMVWVVGKGNQAKPVEVDIGQDINKQTVINSGLKSGDKVVIDNLLKIRTGALLKPQIVTATAKSQADNKAQK